jgi:galactofuranose transport system substrate-binding protein
MKKFAFFTLIFSFIFFFLSCREKAGTDALMAPKNSAEKKIIVGFSQIGAESAWRTCNTKSVRDAAQKAGIQLVYENAEQKQENQIKAIRSFIVYQVDVIVFVPIVVDGWDTVLREAKDAGIPVLIIDRKIHTEDESLYAGFIGTNSEEEGRKCARFLQRKYHTLDGFSSKKYRIFEIRGTEGSSPAMGRTSGFREIIRGDPCFEIIGSESGDFLRSLGKEVMAHALDKYKHIDVIFSHNDGMTLGVLDELALRHIDAGRDICIVTIDAEQAALDALKAGKVNCVVECNPFIGPMVMDLAKKLAAGESIPRLVHVNETEFDEGNDLTAVPPRGY